MKLAKIIAWNPKGVGNCTLDGHSINTIYCPILNTENISYQLICKIAKSKVKNCKIEEKLRRESQWCENAFRNKNHKSL